MRKILWAGFSGIGAAAVLVLGSQMVLAQGRGPEPAAGVCDPNLLFLNGAGATAFHVCLSSEGNVVNMVAPEGAGHIANSEGYELCTPAGHYWDLGLAGQAGWSAPTVSQPKGPNKLPVTITRTSTDGVWSLTQTFALDKKERDLTVTMTLQRLVSAIAAPVYLQRWVDFAMEGTLAGDVASRTADSIKGREIHGLRVTAATLGTSHGTAIGVFPFGALSCTAASAASPLGPTDVSGRVTYDLGSFNVNQKKTVAFTLQVY